MGGSDPWFAAGKTAGKAEAVLAVLAARGLALSDAQREQVQSTVDTAKLGGWLRRAATAASPDDVFTE